MPASSAATPTAPAPSTTSFEHPSGSTVSALSAVLATRGEVSAAFSRGTVAAQMISTIAVGTDGSATASKAVDMAVEMARRFDARIVLLSAYGDPAPGSSPGKVDPP